jgi:hypothetical protein
VTNLGEIVLPNKGSTEVVVVIGHRTPIDPVSTTSGANLREEDFAVLPVERNYRAIATLLPQADVSFLGEEEVNISGATGLENKYFIDGVEVTEPSRGTTGTNLPYNFIKEIEVTTGGYEAEYRSSLGGIVNVITHSGSNEFHGQAFGFFANNRFAGNPRQPSLRPGTGDFTQYDVGVGFGGPIVRDKLWFFVAYNPTYEREDVEVPGHGFHEDKKTAHIFAGKFTWQTTKNNNMVLTVLGDPSDRDAVGEFFGTAGSPPTSIGNPDPFLADISTGGVNVSLRGTHVLGENSLLETSISTIARREKYKGTTERGRNELLFVDTETGSWSGGYFSPADNSGVQTTVGIKETLFLEQHTLTTGFEYRDNRFDTDWEQKFLFRFSDFYRDLLIFSKGTAHNRIPSLFAQDSWRLGDRLRINAGLRWDAQFLVGSDGEVVESITDQYQPRVGLIYQPGEVGSQKIFGSFGRFYQELALNLSSRRHNAGAGGRGITCPQDPRADTTGCVERGRTGVIDPEVDLEGQHYDEFTLGYERRAGTHMKLGLRGVYRTLKQAVEVGFVPGMGSVVGNPGEGSLRVLPKKERDYRALVLTAERSGSQKLSFLASYVLSRNHGNYPGLFNSDLDIPFPNNGGLGGRSEQYVDATGLLPNDRTHVLKISGSYRWDYPLTVGASFSWQSGTPLSERGGCATASIPCLIHLVQRGTAGRTLSIWDLNLRFTYALPWRTQKSWRQRLILDVFHLGSQREPVNFDQVKFRNQENGIQVDPNPTFGLATRFQPPTAVRLGIEATF